MDDLMLPEPVMRTTLPFYDGRDQFYTADQMREYAKRAVEAERARCFAIVETEALQYAEPTWAYEILNDVRPLDKTSK